MERYGAWLACCLSRGPRSPLGEGDVEMLTQEMGEQSYAGGTFVFRQGEAAAMVHIVRTGSVELSRTVKGRRVTLQVLRPGDVFGDVPVFLGEPEPFDARAIEDCTLLQLDSAALYHLLQTRPLVARRWFVSLAERMAGLQGRLVDLLAGGIEAQLTSILLREADECGRVWATQGKPGWHAWGAAFQRAAGPEVTRVRWPDRAPLSLYRPRRSRRVGLAPGGIGVVRQERACCAQCWRQLRR